MLTMIQGSVTIGASGAVTTASGNGLISTPVVKLGADGTYSITCKENYPGFVGFNWSLDPPTTGGAVTAGSFVTGTTYQITALGNTTQAQWVAAGLPSTMTAAVGMPFTAIAAGAGTGTATAVTVGNVGAINIVNPTTQLQSNSTSSGAIFVIECLDFAGALVNPTSGSVIYFNFLLRNSSLSQ